MKQRFTTGEKRGLILLLSALLIVLTIIAVTSGRFGNADADMAEPPTDELMQMQGADAVRQFDTKPDTTKQKSRKKRKKATKKPESAPKPQRQREYLDETVN